MVTVVKLIDLASKGLSVRIYPHLFGTEVWISKDNKESSRIFQDHEPAPFVSEKIEKMIDEVSK